MHILFATWDGAGTVPIDFGIARRLLARGHTVTVLGDPTLAEEAARAGVELRTWRKAPHRASTAREDDVLKDWEPRTPIGLFRRVSERLITGPAADYAAETMDELKRRPPDVVLVDAVILGPMVATEAAGVPTVGVLPGIYVLPAPGMPPFGLGLKPATGTLGRSRDRLLNAVVQAAWRSGLPALNTARASYGLAPLTDPWDQLRNCSRVLVTTAAAFDFPAELPELAHYVGAIDDDPHWAGPPIGTPFRLAPSIAEWTADQRRLPLVVVGFSGSFVSGQEDTLRRVAAALTALGVRGLVCTGPTIDVDRVAGSEHVRVVRAVPHSEVFPIADVVVTHGGHGTITKALMAGKPVLCMPKFRDQHDNAVRMTTRGAGLALKMRASPSQIARALERLITEPGFSRAADELGRRMRAELDDVRLIELIESASR